uniref:Mitochondrial carrier protein n=1 Tax=viral metagenome TaxID=1070528 RepID=A0A6C0JNR4_9ZZZZ
MERIKDYIPGYLQGITRVLISYPFDYIRIFLQINNKDNIKQIIKTNNLYKGVSIPLFIVPIDRAISFKLYETLKSKNYNKLECAIYPSILSSAYMTPINIINYNYIYYKKNIYLTIKNSILNNMYRGNIVELTRNISSSSLFLINYNYLSGISNNHFFNGILSSIMMWVIVYPLDTIKTKKFIENKTYIDIFKNTKLLYYYRGINIVFLKTIPSAGIGMYVYENSKKYLN